MTMQAKPVTQPAVESSEVQRAMLNVTAGNLPPQWMDTQVTAHSNELHVRCICRLGTWTQLLVVL